MTDTLNKCLLWCVPSDDCWEWSGPVDALGYGYVYDDKTTGWARLKSHRVVFEGLVGPLDPGLVLHHTCRTKTCCNPKHLEPLTPGAHSRIHAQIRRDANPTCKKCGSDEWKYRKDDPSRRYCGACQRRRNKKVST